MSDTNGLLLFTSEDSIIGNNPQQCQSHPGHGRRRAPRAMHTDTRALFRYDSRFIDTQAAQTPLC